MTISVILADDQELIRAGFRVLLDAAPDITVVAEAADGAAAVELAKQLHPTIVLMDIRMPVKDGIAATRAIVGARPDVRVLILTTYDLDEYVYEALRAGASGFLLKDIRAGHLIDAVRTVAAGGGLLAPAVTRRLIGQFARRPSPIERERVLASLTPREIEVLGSIARGLSNAEIGAQLFITEATAKTHVARILLKLGLRDRVQAVVLAYECGVVEAGARDPSGLA
jgi:DNA-binding NarL/FixJ family response regulator